MGGTYQPKIDSITKPNHNIPSCSVAKKLIGISPSRTASTYTMATVLSFMVTIGRSRCTSPAKKLTATVLWSILEISNI
jgi:hypothetical protein